MANDKDMIRYDLKCVKFISYYDFRLCVCSSRAVRCHERPRGARDPLVLGAPHELQRPGPPSPAGAEAADGHGAQGGPQQVLLAGAKVGQKHGKRIENEWKRVENALKRAQTSSNEEF